MHLPFPVLYILQQLQQQGFEAYVVGGAVRDLLIEQQAAPDSADFTQSSATDFDFTTNAKPEQILAVFPDAFYENKFGTVSLTHQELCLKLGLAPTETETTEQLDEKVIDVAHATKLHVSLSPTLATETFYPQKNPDYQITTYRSEEVYDDFRRPTSMNWGETLDQDLERRDFTINAMALAITSEVLDSHLINQATESRVAVIKYRLIDPFHGQDDLNDAIIHSVGEAKVRFQEDALRMLRAIRFAVQLNFHIGQETFSAIQANAQLIQHISAERVRDEFLKILASDFPTEGILLLDEVGLLTYILPELLEAKGIAQSGHHTTDVWVHSLDALRYTPSSDPIVRLATLLHDIAKPATQRFSGQNITFYNHEIVGARTARRIAERFKLSKKDIQRVFTLVRYHMFHYQPNHTDAAIRRFMRNVGLDNIDDILALREGDRLGSGAKHTSWRLEEMKQRMQEQLHQPFAITDMALNGDDLIQELRLQPGPIIGTLLTSLFEQVLEKPELNEKATLLKMAQDQLRRV